MCGHISSTRTQNYHHSAARAKKEVHDTQSIKQTHAENKNYEAQEGGKRKKKWKKKDLLTRRGARHAKYEHRLCTTRQIASFRGAAAVAPRAMDLIYMCLCIYILCMIYYTL